MTMSAGGNSRPRTRILVWFPVAAILLVLLALPIPCLAQEDVTVLARVNPDRINIGDVVELTLRVTYPEDVIVLMPGEEIELAPFEIRNRVVSPPAKTPEGLLSIEAKYNLTAFETGDLQIPALRIPYSRTGSQDEEVVETSPLSVTVESLIAEQQEETDIFDIRPPLDFPGSWLSWLLWILFFGAVAAVAAYLWKRFRKEPVLQKTRVRTPIRPPDEVALRALEDLRNSDLLEKGRIKQFHTRASEIVRQYFEGQFAVEALEMTTDEIMRALKNETQDPDWNELCSSFLTRCDLVKFAKMKPIRSACEANLELAFDIVRTARISRRSQAESDEETAPPPRDLVVPETGIDSPHEIRRES